MINCKSKIEHDGDIELWALESYQPNVLKLKEQGINVKQANIENERYPFEDESFDFIIMNQIVEHTKEGWTLYCWGSKSCIVS